MRKVYQGRELEQIAFPLGGLGAGMFCLHGTGSLGNFSIRNVPDVHFEPNVFSALHIRGDEGMARILEGPVPKYKIFCRSGSSFAGAGNGLSGKNYGLPRFTGKTAFQAEFPFAKVTLEDRHVPLRVTITGWSPFIPGDADRSGMPFAALEYSFENPTGREIEAVYSFSAVNFMQLNNDAWVEKRPDGFILRQPAAADQPLAEGAFYAFVDESARVDAAWFRGGWFDSLTMLWKQIQNGETPDRAFADDGKSPGGTLAVPFSVAPGKTHTIRLKLCWYVPESKLRIGADEGCCCICKSDGERKATLLKYRPRYSARYSSVLQLHDEIVREYDPLLRDSGQFRDAFFASTLPDGIMEAISANLSIIKSPTILRQTDGRLWGWEGCCKTEGCCHGTCTHVWNYAQAICHLFPSLERGMRQTEFYECQNAEGHQQFRASLPIRPSAHDFHAASDGQLGGIMKIYREWRILGDDDFLRRIWPRSRSAWITASAPGIRSGRAF